MRLATYRLRKGEREIIVNKSDYHADLARYEGWRRLGESQVGGTPIIVRIGGDPNLENMTKAELVMHAAEAVDLILDPMLKKADMIAAIRDAADSADPQQT